MSNISPGIVVPTIPQRRPKPSGKRLHLFMGFSAILEGGEVVWQDDEWSWNALGNSGEQSVLNVYLKEQANPSKYLALANDATLADTDLTMADTTETKTPASGGYDRIAVAAGDWTDNGLISGDYQFSASQKTFGAFTTAAATITHAVLTTTLTSTAGLILAYNALSQNPTTVGVGQQFAYIFRFTAS